MKKKRQQSDEKKPHVNSPIDSELTCVIPFCNEGEEIEKTVKSIRKTAPQVNILLINDASTDGYDYEGVAAKYGCHYHVNSENQGVAVSRDIGVAICKTPYFVLLDGHMRFYEAGWDKRLVEVLIANQDCLVTSNTVAFHRDEDGKYDATESLNGCPKKYNTYGAFIRMEDHGWEFHAKWSHKKLQEKCLCGCEGVIPVPCVLGAVYAASKRHWQRIGGLWGLRKYGSDEPLMSIKTWLAGGKCLLINDWGVGHLYRKKQPYPVYNADRTYNYLFLIELFQQEEDKIRYRKNLEARSPKDFPKAIDLLNEKRGEIATHKQYLESIFVRDFNWVLTQINDKVKE